VVATSNSLPYLDNCPGWVEAISLILNDLGIHPKAWQEACAVMGKSVAAIALLVVDRNRFHPKAPLRNPGGALRALARAARKGNLDLTRSVFGISGTRAVGCPDTEDDASGLIGVFVEDAARIPK